MKNQELIERYLKMIKLKYIIKRINELEPSAKQYWIDEILKELGSDYGRLKYRSGYEQGKIEGMVEREKVKVPQCVADWYLLHYHDFNNSIVNLCIRREDSIDNNDFLKWISNTKDFIQILVNMHQFGYEVEKEKRYLVKVKGIVNALSFLSYHKNADIWTVTDKNNSDGHRAHHTRKELEEADFGWVFDCPGIEIEEVD